MSETTSTPAHQPEDDPGTFVGGSFGTADNAEDDLTTAQQIEAEQEDPAGFVEPDAGEVPAEVQEQVSEPAGASEALAADVEGIATEEAPGDRNEPV